MDKGRHRHNIPFYTTIIIMHIWNLLYPSEKIAKLPQTVTYTAFHNKQKNCVFLWFTIMLRSDAKYLSNEH